LCILLEQKGKREYVCVYVTRALALLKRIVMASHPPLTIYMLRDPVPCSNYIESNKCAAGIDEDDNQVINLLFGM
jgi:hypothetical protein